MNSKDCASFDLGMKKKIRFVEPRSPNATVFSKEMSLPLLGPVYLATILSNNGYDVKIYNENITDIYQNEELIPDLLDADILMLSCLTSTAPRGYQIAADFKKHNPEKRVVMGGTHASFMADSALEHVDSVVIGEAESIIEYVVESDNRVYAGTHANLDELPLPDFTLIEGLKSMSTTPVSTSRGCPFNCNFCSVTSMFGRNYRFRSSENVMAELRGIKSKNVFFYDDNFTANKRRTKELLTQMKQEQLNFRWETQVRTDVVNDPELLKLMVDTNCKRVYIGFESINPQTLKLFNKAQGVAEIKNSIQKLHDCGISVHGMFVVGSDVDDKRCASRTIDFCHDHDIDTVQLMILTPIPGSCTYDEFNSQNRLITKNWSYYDGHHVVYKPRLMTPLELQTEVVEAMKSFYSRYRSLKYAAKDLFGYYVFSMKNWYLLKKSRAPNLKNYAYKFVGSNIIRKWMRENKDYLSFLAKFSSSNTALSNSC